MGKLKKKVQKEKVKDKIKSSVIKKEIDPQFLHIWQRFCRKSWVRSYFSEFIDYTIWYSSIWYNLGGIRLLDESGKKSTEMYSRVTER